MVVRILVSFWEGLFSGAMLNFGGVTMFDIYVIFDGGSGSLLTFTFPCDCVGEDPDINSTVLGKILFIVVYFYMKIRTHTMIIHDIHIYIS